MSDIELYQKNILEHSKQPLNFKVLEHYNHNSKGYNPLCGDKVEIFMNLENEKVNDISFQGSGCAISMASASILTKVLSKKTLTEANNIFNNFIKMIENKDSNFDQLTTEEKNLLLTFSEIKKFPMRSKCATISWSTFNAALNNTNFDTEVKS